MTGENDCSPSLEVCIVAYGNEATIEEAVSSLVVLGPRVQLAIHDNWPEQGSVARAKATAERLGIPFRAQLCHENCGFARANNGLAASSKAEWLLFLNPDARVLSWPGWDALVGKDIVGAEIHQPDAGGTHVTSGRSRRVRDEIALRWLRRRPKAPIGTGYVSGAALLTRRQHFAGLGGFDEAFFMYYEDIDYCLRANRLGLTVWLEPSWKVEHLGGYSASRDRSLALVRSYDSSLYFFEKHGGARFFRLLAWVDAALRVARTYLVPGAGGQREVSRELERYTRQEVTRGLPFQALRSQSLPLVPVLERATSVTHEHLLAVVLTEARAMSLSRPLRVLDAGCGNGALISYLHGNLSRADSSLQAEIWGFDIHDHGVQQPEFLTAAQERLAERHPEVDWHGRVISISGEDPWPFPDGYFDMVVSNQVGEHIRDLEAFFGRVGGALRTGGVSAHLFPLRDYLFESHLFLPLVHRIRSHDLRVAAIRAMSALGLGKFTQQATSRSELDDFALRHADYIDFLTSYRTWPQVAAAANHSHLRVSSRYTREFYFRKLASLLGRSYPFIYRRRRRALPDAAWFSVFKRLSSVTIFLEKDQAYRRAPSSPLHG